MTRRATVATKEGRLLPPFKMVHVLWVDAVSDDRWQGAEEAKEGLDAEWNVQSVGYLMREEPDYVLLCGSVGVEHDVCMVLKIPRGMIKKITVLGSKRAKAVKKKGIVECQPSQENV